MFRNAAVFSLGLAFSLSLASCLPPNAAPTSPATASATPSPQATPTPKPILTPAPTVSVAPTPSPAATATPAASNPVEPVSFLPKFSSTANQVGEEFRPPNMDATGFGNQDFWAFLSPDNPSLITKYEIRPGSRAKLASGIGIGSTKAEVKTALDPFNKTTDDLDGTRFLLPALYRLTVTYDAAGLVNKIEITPFDSEFQSI